MLKAVKTLLSASLVYGLGTVASKFIGLFLLPVFTNYLKPAEYGLFETFNVMFFLLNSVGALGMDTALIRFYYDSRNPQHRSLVVSSSLFLAFAGGAVLTALGFVLSPALNTTLFGAANHIDIFHVTLLTVLVSIVNTVQFALFQAKREPVRYSVLNFTRFAAMYGLSVYFLIHGDSVYGLMLSQLIAYSIALVLGFVIARTDFHLVFSRAISKEMLVFSAPLIVGGISIWLLSSSDRFFLLRLSTLNELGLYSLGSRLASVVLLAVTSFQMAWPQFALSRVGEENTAYTNARILTYYLFIGILLVLGITLFTPEILRILTAPSYAGAASVVFLLSCSYLFWGCYFVFGIILSITKSTISILPVTIPPFILSAFINYTLVPRMGGMGSAIASTSAYLLMAMLTYYFTNRLFPIRYEWSRIARMAGVAGAVILIGKVWTTDSLLLSIGFKSLLVVGYGAGLLVTRFFLPIELQTIRKIALRPFQSTK